MVICVVAVVAVPAGADADPVGAISGHLVLIVVVVNDFWGVVFKQTASSDEVKEWERESFFSDKS